MYAEANLELIRFESAKLRFMFKVIFLNTMELALIAIFFDYIGRMAEFLVSAGVLMSFRMFSGGFHFKKFRYCTMLKFSIFAAVILILPDVSGTYAVMETLLLVSLLLTIALAPVSKCNVAHTAKNNRRFKIISADVLLAYSQYVPNCFPNLTRLCVADYQIDC